MEFGQNIVISGIIMPHNWDQSGRIVEIALYTYTEEIYPMAHNRLTPELIKLLHRSVEIKGKMMEHPDGNKSIAAQRYVLLNDVLNDD